MKTLDIIVEEMKRITLIYKTVMSAMLLHNVVCLAGYKGACGYFEIFHVYLPDNWCIKYLCGLLSF